MKRLKNWFGGGRRPLRDFEIPLDLTCDAFIADPAPIYEVLRARHPMCPVSTGGYILTRHGDIMAALSSPILGNAPARFSVLAPRHRDKTVAAALAANIPPFLDKPEHVPARRALSHAFYRTFEAMSGRVEDIANEEVSRHRGGSRLDLISQIARPFAVRFMAAFVGLPHEPDALVRTSEALFDLFAPIADRTRFDATNQALEEARRFVKESVTAARRNPGADLISELCRLSEGSDGRSDEQIADNAILVLADGIQNVEAAIAMALSLLQKEKDVRQALADGTVDPRQVARECIRLSTPGQIIPRVVRQTGFVCGQELSEGTPVFLALGSANLDGDVHHEPEAFWVHRDTGPVLSFGAGRHSCIGEPMAVMMVGAMIKSLVVHGAGIQPGRLQYQSRFGHRWPVELPVTVS